MHAPHRSAAHEEPHRRGSDDQAAVEQDEEDQNPRHEVVGEKEADEAKEDDKDADEK